MVNCKEINEVNPSIVEVVYRNMINAFINLELEEYHQMNKKEQGLIY